jgi:putative pyruvate formate lyase activating enzyme
VECGEEPELVPSHLFYVSGCDLRCAFCIAEANAFDPGRGTILTAAFLQRAIAWGRTRGARNLQWVGGEPTIHLPNILRVMAECPSLPPIVWKSDFYGTTDTWRLLAGVVDCFVADFKFGNDDCACRIGSVDRYVHVVTRNLKTVAQNQDLIVRHLLMPGHFDCCFVPVTQWLARELPGVKFSLRDGYLPRWQARRHAELGAPVPRNMVRRARDWANELGLRMVN